ncbi:unnamed protein product, partial [Linum tenue]
MATIVPYLRLLKLKELEEYCPPTERRILTAEFLNVKICSPFG